jgi:HEAT repeat protein
LIYFCPVCWKEIPAQATTCPHCSADLRQTDSRTFVEKLLSALHHREPQTAVRAAWILGERRDRVALHELICVLESATDGFLVEAAAEALGKIGDNQSLDALQKASEQGPVRVRIAAQKAIEAIHRATH